MFKKSLPMLFPSGKLNMFSNWQGGVNMYVIACYFSYLIISVALTIWVARTLHAGGRIFLMDAFNGKEGLAHSLNRPLVVVFYLINGRYIALSLNAQETISSLREAIELESPKLGV